MKGLILPVAFLAFSTFIPSEFSDETKSSKKVHHRKPSEKDKVAIGNDIIAKFSRFDKSFKKQFRFEEKLRAKTKSKSSILSKRTSAKRIVK